MKFDSPIQPYGLDIDSISIIVDKFEKKKPGIAQFQYWAILVTIIIASIFALLILFLIFMQFKFILSNETTSENLRKIDNVKNPFNRGCKSNLYEFVYRMDKYRDNVSYNKLAIELLVLNQLVTDYYETPITTEVLDASTCVPGLSHTRPSVFSYQVKDPDIKMSLNIEEKYFDSISV